MSRHLKVRHGRSVQVGDVVIEVVYARRGEACLRVTAPQQTPIRVLPRSSAPTAREARPTSPPPPRRHRQED